MTKQEIYEQIVRLTGELQFVNLADKIFDAVKTENPKNVENVFETFRNESFELHQRIVSFGKEYNELAARSASDANIFGIANDEFVFDPLKVDASNLYVLTFFGKIDEIYLFSWGTESADRFILEIEKDGYDELAEFISSNSWLEWIGEDEEYALYELLIAIFKGECK